jgi:hypothetical protein
MIFGISLKEQGLIAIVGQNNEWQEKYITRDDIPGMCDQLGKKTTLISGEALKAILEDKVRSNF